MRTAVRIGLVLMAGASLAACATVRPEPKPAPSATRSYTNPAGQKVGKPYQIGGVWYVPREQPNYDEKGIASWYGPGFHLKSTAMGEIFDMDAVSAAHTTLPLPSMVEVTNLDNGRKLVVRVNDRGPFHDGRIIDLSREAARQLDFERAGVARVRVRYLGPPDLLGPRDGLRYAKSEGRKYAEAKAKPGFKFSLKPSFPIVVPPPVTPPLMTAAPTAIATTASAVPKVVDALTPSIGAPSVRPAVPPSEPIRIATLPPADIAPALPSPTIAPATAPVWPMPPVPATMPASSPVSVPVTIEQTVGLPPPEVPTPSVTPPQVEINPSPGLRIQAGAFASKANAQRAVSQLASAGAATIEPMTRADGVTLYRVVITAPADEAAAYALRDRVEEIGFADAQVVRLF